jgi:hypothetical protein
MKGYWQLMVALGPSILGISRGTKGRARELAERNLPFFHYNMKLISLLALTKAAHAWGDKGSPIF